ncbi:MAG: patatin-like phospholipase family protein, partial [Senegalia sp. (in: firmicutes)]
MNGLYLQGGGAKGAFQAGVIYGLNEKGIDFDIISGTSIGAINGYYIYTDSIDKLKETWLHMDENELGKTILTDKVIENKILINKLENLKGENNSIKKFYVNYVNVSKN